MAKSFFSIPLQLTAAVAVGYGGVTLVTQPQSGQQFLNNLSTTVAKVGECNIKGNVSIDSGERIYHVPGQRYYASTKIDPRYGERWFCSEIEAMAAGWRKSRQ